MSKRPRRGLTWGRALRAAACAGLALALSCGDSDDSSGQSLADTNLAAVTRLVDEVINGRDLDAADALIAAEVVEHSPARENGRAAFKEFYAARFAAAPDFHVQTRRAIAAGDLVVLHNHLTSELAERGDDFGGTAVSDVYRLADGVVVEHWEVVQDVPPVSVNDHTMFDGGAFAPDGDPVANEAAARRFFAEVLNGNSFASLEELTDGYIQHNPTIENGIAALYEFTTQLHDIYPEYQAELKRVVAAGNLVAIHSQVTFAAADRGDDFTGLAVVDWWRFVDGRIVEHWDTLQPVPPTSASGNGMF